MSDLHASAQKFLDKKPGASIHKYRSYIDMHVLKYFHKGKDTYEFHAFPRTSDGQDIKLRLDFEVAREVEEDLKGDSLEDHYLPIIERHLVQDIFDIVQVVAERNTSKDIFNPVIPEVTK